MTNRHTVVRLALASLSLLAIVLALGVLVFYTASRVGAAVTAAVLHRSSLAEKDADVSLLLTLRSEAERATVFESTLRNVLPAYDELYLFGNEVRRLALERGVDAGFSFGKTTELSGEPGRVAFSITLRGSYTAIASFLSSLESSMYFVSFSSVDLFRQAEEFRGSLRGDVFFNAGA